MPLGTPVAARSSGNIRARAIGLTALSILRLSSACSFLVTRSSATDEDLHAANYFLKHRGPDATNVRWRRGVAFMHNLLSITGPFTVQPFVDRTNDVVALFNGEIYNFRELGVGEDLRSDGEALLPSYSKHGETFARVFRGEFAIAIADFKHDLLITMTDTFGTKPFWRASDADGQWGISSYRSALDSLGFSRAKELPCNTIEVRQLHTFALLRSHRVFSFDLRQHKTSLRDWEMAFDESMRRRIGGVRHPIFIGLSAGLDSGMVGMKLARARKPHHIFSILNGYENQSVVTARHAYAKDILGSAMGYVDAITLSRENYAKSRRWLLQHAEEYKYTNNLPATTPRGERRPRMFWDDLRGDPGAIGLSIICERAHPLGLRIYLSGAGSDEIYSDYGNSTWCSFCGTFPDNLSAIFPWPGFYGTSQRNFLRTEEHVAGAHGMEGRYPFLDVDLVQEFLWLSVELKNRALKYPILETMRKYSYPRPTRKTGFNAGKQLMSGPDTTQRRSITDILDQDRSVSSYYRDHKHNYTQGRVVRAILKSFRAGTDHLPHKRPRP